MQHSKAYRAKIWTPQSELFYQMTCSKEHLMEGQILPKYLFQEVDSVLANKPIDTVVDVGGGPFGGALYYLTGGKRRILYDFLADEYIRMAVAAPNVEFIQGDFGDMPFGDGSVDVVFAWEVLDHALSMEHFRAGQKELIRILAKDGILFFNIPLRGEEEPYHFLINEGETKAGFHELESLREVITEARMGALCGAHLYCIYRKV